MNNVPEYPANANMINIKLGQAYVPYQQYKNLYPVDEALTKGTIFVDLYRPYKSKYKPLK